MLAVANGDNSDARPPLGIASPEFNLTKWETQTRGSDLRLLSWPFGTWALPVVLAVVPR